MVISRFWGITAILIKNMNRKTLKASPLLSYKKHLLMNENLQKNSGIFPCDF